MFGPAVYICSVLKPIAAMRRAWIRTFTWNSPACGPLRAPGLSPDSHLATATALAQLSPQAAQMARSTEPAPPPRATLAATEDGALGGCVCVVVVAGVVVVVVVLVEVDMLECVVDVVEGVTVEAVAQAAVMKKAMARQRFMRCLEVRLDAAPGVPA